MSGKPGELQPEADATGVRETSVELLRAWKLPGFLPVCAIMFLWSLDTSGLSVRYLYVTDTLHFSEQAAGNGLSMTALGSAIASALYGLYCRHIRTGRLVYLAIGAGVVSYGIYWNLATVETLYAASFIGGVAYMTGTLVQLDIAARVVPLRLAATLFAVIMALSNFALSLAEGIGGVVYEALSASAGPTTGYRVTVALSIGSVLACCALMPWLKRDAPEWWR